MGAVGGMTWAEVDTSSEDSGSESDWDEYSWRRSAAAGGGGGHSSSRHTVGSVSSVGSLSVRLRQDSLFGVGLGATSGGLKSGRGASVRWEPGPICEVGGGHLECHRRQQSSSQGGSPDEGGAACPSESGDRRRGWLQRDAPLAAPCLPDCRCAGTPAGCGCAEWAAAPL